MPYLEYALTSAVTSRWFLSFRRSLLDTFSTENQTKDSGFLTGPTISFGHQLNGSDQDRRGRIRKLDTFISSYVPRTIQSLHQDEFPAEAEFNNSMTYELKPLDLHLHPDLWDDHIKVVSLETFAKA